MKLTPASYACATISFAAAASVRSPNIIVPRHSTETSRPLWPRRRNCMARSWRKRVVASCSKGRRGATRVQSAPHLAVARPMHVLFEDDGQLKAGTVLADHDASLQVEAASGKRLKIKAASVLLRFESPAPGEALGDAQKLAADLDANFLWEAVGDGEFGFDDLAREY